MQTRRFCLTLYCLTLGLFLSGSPAAAQSKAIEEASRLVNRSLHACEKIIVDAVLQGKPAQCGEGDPQKSNIWPDSRQVDAAIIRWLCSVKKESIGVAGIRIHGAKIVGKLDLSHLVIPFPVSILDSVAEEEMDLSAAAIKDVDFSGTRTQGFVAEALRVQESAGFGRNDASGHRFYSRGRIHLVGAEIGKYLSFDGAILENDTGPAVIADGIRVSQSILMRSGFTARGGMRFLRATIEGDLNGLGGAFMAPGGIALDAERATIGGNLRLDRDDRLESNFVAAGELSFPRVIVQNDVYLNDAEFTKDSRIDLTNATVTGVFRWQRCAKSGKPALVILDLRGARITSLETSPECWPSKGNLYLDGFRYERFGDSTNLVPHFEWVRLQPTFVMDSYREMARVFKDYGDLPAARNVLITAEFDLRTNQNPNPVFRLWNWILFLTTGYGYAPWRASFPAIAVVVLGAIIFYRAFRAGIIAPTEKDAYSNFMRRGSPPRFYVRFSPLIYSLDAFLPIITFGQRDKWLPNAVHGEQWLLGFSFGWWVRCYLWLHIALGWLLTTLFVAAVTGFLRNP
jgi:hypothetical protein